MSAVSAEIPVLKSITGTARLGDYRSKTSELVKLEDQIQNWVEQCVIGLSLCPFAAAPYRAGRVRVVICEADSAKGYLATIKTELNRLAVDDAEETKPKIETTLIASASVFSDFLDFNDFLTSVDALLQVENLDTEFQAASFHPAYRFAGVDESDVGNFTNRAPCPIVQWLRADTVSKAAEAVDTLAIPEANIKRLTELEPRTLRMLFPWVSS